MKKTKFLITVVLLLVCLYKTLALGFNENDIPRTWPTGPDKDNHISRGFGPFTDPITGEFKIHKGVDLSNRRAAQKIYATEDGIVTKIFFDEKKGYSNILIQHDNNISTLYGNLTEIKVKAGDSVKKMDLLGVTGTDYVHYEIHIGDDFIDPEPFLEKDSVK